MEKIEFRVALHAFTWKALLDVDPGHLQNINTARI
jgi:hypothetical protein